MQEINLPPHAASLIQSLRDIGYSLETAIADLIDNSITAGANTIDIYLDIQERDTSSLCIIDDGGGMSENELLEAMRPGSRNPRETRSAEDLGRFGLGLKTASFSQCKSLTVVSRKDGRMFGARWDLDLIEERNEWVVTILTEDVTESLPFIEELDDQGTYVLWQKLDRMLEGAQYDFEKELYARMDVVEQHLALVFHRYVSGDYTRRKLTICINNDPIEEFDPFCISNKATQLLHQEILRIDGHDIIIQPYILPHHSKLTAQSYDFYKERSDFVSNQGAYVYRNGRLMAWGDWFRIVAKGEGTKLARVQIDFPNALDEHWKIDIKKSRAEPPKQVKDKMRQIIERITEQSKQVHVGRGKKLFQQEDDLLWERYADRGRIRYEVNREHPLVSAIEARLDPTSQRAFNEILSVIGQSIPLEAIYSDYATKPQEFEKSDEISHEDMKDKLIRLYELFIGNGDMDPGGFQRMISTLKPFSEHAELVAQILEEISHD